MKNKKKSDFQAGGDQHNQHKADWNTQKRGYFSTMES